MKVLMVCLGNICRSPIAEGIMYEMIERQGLDWEVDSAGTSAYHAGEQADSRSIKVMDENGIDIRNQRSRQFVIADFDRYDVIFCMDESNLENVLALARNQAEMEKVEKLLHYHPDETLTDVPDPYYEDNFPYVYEIIHDSVGKFISSKIGASS